MEQTVLSLKRAAWSPRVLTNAVVVSGQQTSNQYDLSRLHAELRLRLPVPSSTCHFRIFSITAGFSFLPALNAYSGHQLARTDSTLQTKGLSTVAQQAETAVTTTKL